MTEHVARHRVREIKTIAAAACGVLLIAGLVALTMWVRIPDCVDAGCPSFSSLESHRPPEPPHYFDREGRLVGHLPGEVRLWVPLDSLPPGLPSMLIAVEDRRFRSHKGIDGHGIARATVVNLRAGGVREGASTITMQLARTLWRPGLEGMNRWRRKIVEMRVARRLERHLSKDQILEQYLNRVYLGSGVYGVGAAAHHYFGKRAAELDLAEMATLVGTIKTPERYNPSTRPELAKERRDVVLSVIANAGLAAAEHVEAARNSDLSAVTERPVMQGRTYFAAAVGRELRRLVPDPEERSGLRVYTTLDRRVQASLERRVVEQIERIEAGRLVRFRHAVPGDELGRAEGDSEFLQGAAVSLDVRTGAVRGLVGGRSFEHSEFDRAFLARRQPGSAFKPIVYAAALEERAVTLGDPVDTAPVQLAVAEGTWAPADEQASDERMSARHALARSSNWAAVRVGSAVGVESVASIAARLGIESRVDPVPASFLGASVLRPVELVAAYASLANGGLATRPHLIERIEDREGRVIWQHEHRTTPVLDPAVAFLTVEALKQVVDGGTGGLARSSGYRGPAAGKTGTTDDWRDAWFVGFNGELATGVWFGFDQPRRIAYDAFGGRIAAPVWGAVMADVYGAGANAPAFPARPPGVRSVEIDAASGYAVSDACEPEQPTTEFFLVGTEPDARCEIRVIAPEVSTELTSAPLPALSAPRTQGQSQAERSRASGGH